MADITIRINGLDRHSVRNAITELKKLQADNEDKMDQVCERLATYGAFRASMEFSRSEYVGINDVSVSAEKTGNGWQVKASGDSVLFLEYGSGASRGYGHPNPQGYGPGTYPGKGHWNDPKGWYYKHGVKSFGNPPAAAMYYAEQDIRAEIERVVSEVFGA